MSEGEIAKPQPAQAPEKKLAAVADTSTEQARSRLSLDAGLADPKKPPGATDQGQARDATPQVLEFGAIAGYDSSRIDGADRLHLVAERPGQKSRAGVTELAHGDRSKIVKDKTGAVSDQGDINGTHYDITASKDKDSIVWKDKDGKEHRFERKKGENRNQYVDGDGTTLVQHGDHNTVTFKEGFQVDIDARTGHTIIKRDEKEVATYNGKDTVKRQLDDNNVAFQVRGDVGATVDQIKDYQKRTGQPQNGNMIIKNEKGDTVVLQQDGTEIYRKADSTTVTIKQGDTTVEYTPGQSPKIISGEQHIKQLNGGIQIDGKEMLNSDGSVAISGMKDGRLDSRHGRIYGTTDKGGQIDLGTGRAIADTLTTTNTGTGVEATTSNGTVILKTGTDGKQIESGPVTTNVDATNPTTTIHGSDGSTININNADGSSSMIDSSGADIANINASGDVCTWDGSFLGADGNIFNLDMDFSGFTSYESDGASNFTNSREHSVEERHDYTESVAASCTTAVGMADSVCSEATSLANNLNASVGTLGQIDAGIGTLAAFQAQAQALLPFNPGLADEISALNQAWSRLEGIRSRVQNEVAVQEILNTRYGVTDKSSVANALNLGINAVDSSAA
ncbi:hypothetical protein BH10CYA1_BH10CYA1_61020 [soil metagenome]